MKSFSLFNLWRVDRVCIITIQTVKHSPQTSRIWTKRFSGGYSKDRISLHYYAVKHKIKILLILNIRYMCLIIPSDERLDTPVQLWKPQKFCIANLRYTGFKTVGFIFGKRVLTFFITEDGIWGFLTTQFLFVSFWNFFEIWWTETGIEKASEAT